MLRVVLDEESGIYDARSDALSSFGDAVMEALVSGKGPLGPIGCFGLFFGILVRETAFNHVESMCIWLYFYKTVDPFFRSSSLQRYSPCEFIR